MILSNNHMILFISHIIIPTGHMILSNSHMILSNGYKGSYMISTCHMKSHDLHKSHDPAQIRAAPCWPLHRYIITVGLCSQLWSDVDGGEQGTPDDARPAEGNQPRKYWDVKTDLTDGNLVTSGPCGPHPWAPSTAHHDWRLKNRKHSSDGGRRGNSWIAG